MTGACAVQHPMVAAACAVLYLIGRVLYFQGYKTGNPDARLNGGKVFGPAFLALIITNLKIAGVWATGLLA